MQATAFQGGFGLVTLQGVPKPSFRAFELLHRLGTEAVCVFGSHDTVDVWVLRGGSAVTVLITNHVLPRHPIQSEAVRSQLVGLLPPRDVYIERIADDHANARKLWIEMRRPPHPRPRDMEQMRAASRNRTRATGLSPTIPSPASRPASPLSAWRSRCIPSGCRANSFPGPMPYSEP